MTAARLPHTARANRSSAIARLMAATSLAFIAFPAAHAADFVSDAGPQTISTAVIADNFIVGQNGTADVTLDTPGSFTTTSATAGDIILGDAVGSDGTITTNGATSLVANRFYIGLGGNGTLTVNNGGTMTARGDDRKVYVGYFVGSTGTLNLDGPATTMTAYDFNVAWISTGNATLSNGATATIEQDVTIGKNPYTTGTLTITGTGSRVSSDRLYVGELGASNGTLTIENGGAFEVTGTSRAYIGNTAGSRGTVNVTGNGSSFASNLLFVGWNGTAEMTISDKATTTIAADVYVGTYGPSTGTLTVTGSGSALTADRIYLGDSGSGTLNVLDGGSVTATGTGKIYLGNTAAGKGFATVSGTGSQISAVEINVGWNDAGVLTVDDGGSVTTAGSLSLGYNATGSGTMTLATAGAVSIGGGTGTVHVATAAGSTGTINIGAASGDPAAAAGTLNAAAINFGAGDGKIVFNHTDTAYQFGANISGAGSLLLESGTTILTGTNTYTGGTTVKGGHLLVNGSVTGATTIENGGVLSGTGTLGTLVVQGGATLAPGNSIGTLTTGDMTFADGSVYAVEVNDAGASDKLVVNGTVTIGSTARVVVTPANGIDDGSTYLPSTPYTIVSSTGGVTGTFAAVTESFAYLDAMLAYGSNDVTLTLTRTPVGPGPVPFADKVSTRNGKNAANAIDAMDPASALYNAALTLQDGETESAFAQLSGDIHANTMAGLMQRSGASRQTILNRIRGAFDGSGTTTGPVTAYGEGAFGDLLPRTLHPNAWMSGFGSWSDHDGDGNAAASSAKGGGVLFGADAPLGDGWRLGLAGGYGHDDIKSLAVNSLAKVDSYYLSAYGGRQIGPATISFGALHAFQQVETSRVVSLSSYNDTLTASYDGSTSQAFVEGAWRFERDLFHVEPYANLTYTYLHTDGFTEQGSATALTSGSNSYDQLSSTIGVRFDRYIAFNNMLGKLSGGLGWRHGYGDLSPQTNLAFSGSQSFTVAGAALARDTALVNAGISFDLTDKATVSLRYDGQFADGLEDQTVSSSLRVKF
ncbi:autotransporter domain-containing protein [Hoeflea olei]|uniref:Autotransporter domain-containing protein n=1 Tax=Hoeflea olei TaxID=1480615 RepID=A0A1C1YYK8_9HYPH|nr:autotransporter domain-containing protein [Hoeflea olei]OCW58562.1 hypothetical protein AWJ14_05295 [Hoeflea olei]